MTPWAAETLPRFLRPAAATAVALAEPRPTTGQRRQAWQPADFFPDPSRPTFPTAVAALRAAASQLPDDLVVCLAFAAVSDAALPLQLPALLNAAAAAATAEAAAPPSPLAPRDHSGSDAHAWAAFVRAWSSEAKRHGDGLRGWLYLSGRADLGALEASTQRLLGGGAALLPAVAAAEEQGAEKTQRPAARARSTDYYAGLMYAAYHLRCGGVAAANAARLAAYHMGEEEEDEGGNEGGGGERQGSGDASAAAAASLPRLLSAIAADKARHEAAFSAAAAEALRRDPCGALAALSSALASGALLRSPAAALGCDVAGGGGGTANDKDDEQGDPSSPSSSSSSSLFLDASAVADALGVLTLRDRAAALDALCAQWGVQAAGEAAASSALERGDSEGAREARARAAFALAHGGRLRSLADLQTERRLRDRRKGAARVAPFAWVFGRECGLS